MRPCTVGADRAGVEVPGWAARIYRTNVGACLRYWTSLGLLMALTLADEQRRLRRTAPSLPNSAVSDEQRRLSTSQLPCGLAGAVLRATGCAC